MYSPIDHKKILKVRKKKIEFIELCQKINSADEIFTLVEKYRVLGNKFGWMSVKLVYNKYIGWALPSRKACTLIVDTWHESGIFTYVFHQLGVPTENLLPNHLLKPSHRNSEQRIFWPPTLVEELDFQVDPNDIIFIAWGSSVGKVVNSYVERGGFCVIIQGEEDGGCTFPSDYFTCSLLGEDDEEDKGEGESESEFGRNPKPGWEVQFHEVPAAAKYSAEILSINRKVY